MLNPSFCQELVKRSNSLEDPVFPPGTHDVFVGDKRGARVGQTRLSWGTNGRLFGNRTGTDCYPTNCKAD